MPGDPRAESLQLLGDYAREPGRSVLVRVEMPGTAWESGVAADDPRPAASLLKMPLAMAVERAFAGGDLDPRATVTVRRLLVGDADPGPLHVLGPDLPLTIGLLVDVSRSQERLIDIERDAASQFFSQVLRHLEGGHLRRGEPYNFHVVQTGDLIMMRAYSRIAMF